MLHGRMWSTRTTSHIFRSFFQRNRSTIMLVHTIRSSIASTSLFDIQSLFSFRLVFISLQILSYFITNLFYFFQGVPWFWEYRSSSNRGGRAQWLTSVTNYRSHEREIPKILGWSSSRYNSCKLSPSFIQEEVYYKIAWTV